MQIFIQQHWFLGLPLSWPYSPSPLAPVSKRGEERKCEIRTQWDAHGNANINITYLLFLWNLWLGGFGLLEEKKKT